MDARRYASLPDPFPDVARRRAARRAHRLRDLGHAERGGATTRCCSSPVSPRRRTPPHPPQDPSEGWWQGMVGPKLAHRHASASSSSASTRSAAASAPPVPPRWIRPPGKPYRLSFPDLSIEDIARAGYETVRSLGIERLDTVMGPSLGGMVVLAYAAHVSAGRAAPGVHLRHRGGGAVCDRAALDPARGHHHAIRPGRAATTAPITRRSPGSASRASSAPSPIARPPSGSSASAASRSVPTWHATDPFASEFAVQGYLEALAQSCDERLRRQLLPLHLPRHGSLRASRARGPGRAVPSLPGSSPALVIGVQSDLLFSVSEQRAIADMLASAGVSTRFAPLPCIEGHDAFLVDLETFGRRDRRVPAKS